MSGYRFTFLLANGQLVHGALQGFGGVLTAADIDRVAGAIAAASSGEPAAVLEPRPGCAVLLPDYSAGERGAEVVIELKGAALLDADLPANIAQAAHAGTSFSPEDRAQSERAGYACALRSAWEVLAKHATTPEKLETLRASFADLRDGYRSRYLSYLQARARCMSTMIAGPSGFPTRRQQKINDAADRRRKEVQDFLGAAIARISKALQPEVRPIMAGDADAVVRTESKLEKAEKLQAMMTATNAAIRKHKKSGHAAQLAALVELGHPESIARQLLEPDFAGRVGYADFQLKNNSAEIRRLRARGAQLAEAKSQDTTEIEGEHAKLEDSPPDNRVRLFFPGKPAPELRDRLKSAGFRWAPSLGCWQAYRNHRALEAARRFAGIAA